MKRAYLLYLSCILLNFQAQAQFSSDDYSTAAMPMAEINDGYANFNFIVGDNGTSLWFTKSGHPRNTGGERDQDIWYMEYNDGSWSVPSNTYEGLNSERNDLIIGQSENTKVYLLRYLQDSNKEFTTIEAYRRVEDRYIFDHKIRLPELNIAGSFFGFYVARDESFIIVSMKGDFSYGKEDLYICLNEGGTWTAPIHMGARINTAGFEMSPYVSRDRKHLFFSSEGHRSYGKGDVFVSTRLDESWQNWSKPINLGPNINTPGFEAYFTLNETLKEAYFYSDRMDGSGNVFKIAHKVDKNVQSMSPHQMASGFVKFNELKPMQVKLNLMDANDQIIQSVTTSEDGYFNLQAFIPDRNYKIAIDETVKQDLSEAEIYLANDLGDKMVFMNEDELGIFAFRVLSGSKIREAEEFEQLASRGKIVDKPTTITGKVAGFGTLSEKVTLKITDEENRLLSTIETDEQGYFTFSTEAKEKRYFLSVDKDLSGLVDVYEVYLTNNNPHEDILVTKTDKHLFEFTTLINGGDSPIALLEEKDAAIPIHIVEALSNNTSMNQPIAGYLRKGTLPLINTEISLLDENDVLLGSMKTSADGSFSFDTDLGEGEYQLRLTEEQSQLLEGSEIFLARNPDDVIFYLNDNRSGVFAFKKLAKDKPLTLYSLRTRAEDGLIISEGTTLTGKFRYDKLPATGVTLTLLDESENVVQQTKVAEDGTFVFSNFIPDKNYFIAASPAGLSDIYEIYLSGNNKNVLVNRTNKFVFGFKVLPSQDIVLTRAFENNPSLPGMILPLSEGLSGDNEGAQRSFHEFDLVKLKKNDYLSMKRVIDDAKQGKKVVIRVFIESKEKGDKVKLATITKGDIEPLLEYLQSNGIERKHIDLRLSNSDQAILIIGQH